MKPHLSQLLWFTLAAVCELAGCYAFWAWARLGRPIWWLAWGIGSLVLFAWALSRTGTAYAGRAFAAYGGVYITAALAWLVIIDRARPDRYDFTGVALCLAGTMIILFAPR